MVNNPTGVGLHEAKLLFGADSLRKGTVISVGTGKPLNKHSDYNLLSKGLAKDTTGTSWKDKFNKILDSATDTEGTYATNLYNRYLCDLLRADCHNADIKFVI